MSHVPSKFLAPDYRSRIQSAHPPRRSTHSRRGSRSIFFGETSGAWPSLPGLCMWIADKEKETCPATPLPIREMRPSDPMFQIPMQLLKAAQAAGIEIIQSETSIQFLACWPGSICSPGRFMPSSEIATAAGSSSNSSSFLMLPIQPARRSLILDNHSAHISRETTT